jgi:hypothetical protein
VLRQTTLKERNRNETSVIQASVDVNTWMRAVPDVDTVRPSRCPSCGAAGRPSGGPLGMVGHGVRSRQVQGPAGPGQSPSVRVLQVRRYRCARCKRAVTVVPRGLVARRRYAASAIALACLCWSFGQRTLEQTRGRVAPGQTFESGWPAVGRWLAAIGAGAMFSSVRSWPAGVERRRQAERVAATVMAFAPSGVEGDEARLFAGAALAA